MDRLAALIEQLRDSRSPKRRSAALKLRRAGDPGAREALQEALRREVTDQRTWETQYQMIMALGECGCVRSRAMLAALKDDEVAAPKLAPMVHLALGDALLRLAPPSPHDLGLALPLLESSNPGIADGAMRAIALFRLKFDEPVTKQLIELAQRRRMGFWAVAAAAGWSGDAVRAFLEHHASSPIVELRNAALTSLVGRYVSWKIL